MLVIMPVFLSKGISFLFHPLLMPTYLFAIMLSLFPTLLRHEELKWLFLGIVLITTFVIPVWVAFFFKHMGFIKSVYLKSRKERLLPFIATTIIYAIASYFFSTLNIDVFNVLPKMMLLMTVSIGVTLIITFFWQISAHAIGISGILGVITRIAFSVESLELLLFLMIGIIISGFVMSARLQLNAHTTSQIYAGFGVGFFSCFIPCFWILT